MNILQTDRLELRQLDEGDAAFILALVNSPGWLEFIGDKGIRTEHAAKTYIQEGPKTSYLLNGYGLYAVVEKASEKVLGVCGLVKREQLAFPDVGFAFLPEHMSQGFALEAAQAVLEHAHAAFHFATIYAVTTLHNERSVRLLGKLGMGWEKIIRLNPSADELNLFSKHL
ncbi:GNAT family N-acetyltransferase [Rufibacter sp. LB8]|uniref:GNAT family N-acetyltransferase n=1 Tax=Rufibacter sp. LB8 TaxID=2777781 RepID=UPI00178C7418|nr:GNAT family N-acetyltransferase [Rufibacter sp. LB8]